MFIVRCGRRARRVLTVTLIAICASVSSASADQFIVTTFSDLPDRVPGDGSCTTVEEMRCSLRAALMEASARAGDSHVIVLAAGVYVLTGNSGEDLGIQGDLDIRVSDGSSRRITILGAGPPPAYCDGICAPLDPRYTTTIVGSSNRDRVFDIWWNVDVVIQDLAIIGGDVKPLDGNGTDCTVPVLVGDPRPQWHCETGGAIRSRSPLTLSNVAIYGNAAGSGGGIHSMQSLRLTSVAVIGNTTKNMTWGSRTVDVTTPWACGGGILHDRNTLTVFHSVIHNNVSFAGGGGICTFDNTEIRDTTISYNFSLNGDGGGIRAVLNLDGGDATLSVVDSTLLHNVASPGNGGGISLRGSGEFHKLRVEHNWAATAAGVAGKGHGGGISVQDEYRSDWPGMLALRASDLTVAANRSYARGGGIFLGPGNLGARTEIIGATISNNRSGPGIAALHAELHDVALTNVTLSGNSGSVLSVANANLDLFHSTIAFNGRPPGRGWTVGPALYARDSAVVMKGNLFHRNNPANCDFSGMDPVSLGGNLADSSSCPSDEPAGEAARRANLDYLLADNGGPTKTHALREGSIALDRIDAGNCTAASGAPLTVDQRGFPRPSGAGCDAGAYELFQFNINWSEWPVGRFAGLFLVMTDGAHMMLAEMIRENNPNVDRADRLVRELDLASQKLGLVAGMSAPQQLMDLVDELAAHLSRAEQVRLSFDRKSLGVSAVRWKSLGLLGSYAQDQLTVVKKALSEPPRQ